MVVLETPRLCPNTLVMRAPRRLHEQASKNILGEIQARIRRERITDEGEQAESKADQQLEQRQHPDRAACLDFRYTMETIRFTGSLRN